MKRRYFLGLLFGSVAVSGCARLTPSQIRDTSDGIIVKPAPERAGNATEFLPDGATLYVSGGVNADTATAFNAVLGANPALAHIVFLSLSAPQASEGAQDFARAIRRAGLSTHARNDSVLEGGAIDAYLGGTRRTMEQGAVFGVLTPSTDAENYAGFVNEMTGGDGFARYSAKFGGAKRPRHMTIAEIGAMGLISGSAQEVMTQN